MNVEEESNPQTEALTPVCAIGASAGGIRALQSFFEQVDDELGLAYVVIIHLSPDHESQLSEILTGRTDMEVIQVGDTPTLKPNCVYVIAPDRELVIEGNNIHSRPFTEPRGQRAPIDMFFRSVAAGRGDGFAVVMSGAGSDGAVGVRKIKEAGGVVFVQDPAEAEYGMMPHSAIATGVADFVEPVERMVERVAEVARSKDALRRLDDDEAEGTIRQIVAFLHARTGHDFSSYKRATVMRRIARRMQVTRRTSLKTYANYLAENPEEAQELFGDLLISVTAFFRDPPAFEALVEQALRPLFRDLEPDEVIRVWSVGCATGEEAYSLAMLAVEEAERLGIAPSIQIFATDLDDGALATAREGRYPKAIEADVSPDRLKRFFVRTGERQRARQVAVLRDKYAAGAERIVTQACFRSDNALRWLEGLRSAEVPLPVHLGVSARVPTKTVRVLLRDGLKQASRAPIAWLRNRPNADLLLRVLTSRWSSPEGFVDAIQAGRAGHGPLLREGMVLAIEPMLSAGTPRIKTLEDGWTVITADRSLSAHFEHTILITEHGPEILTAVPGSH